MADISGRVAQVVSTLALSCIATLVSFVSQIILHPVYGSVATGLHHDSILLFVLLNPVPISSERLAAQQWRAIALLLISAPLHLPALFSFSSVWGPVWGPILTQAFLTWPCVFFTSNSLHRTVKRGWVVRIAIAAVLVTLLRYSQALLATYVLPFVGIVWSRFSILVYLGLFAGLIDSIPSVRRREYITVAFTFAAILPVALFVLSRPHVLPGVTDGLLARLPSEYTYLARQESLTGMITVVENSQAGYRVLKCDHSLLGGLWTGIKKKELEAEGTADDLEFRSVQEAESVYTAFYLQEAACLVQSDGRSSQRNKALIIGLGIGITANYFHKCGMNVTAIEIDPIVHRFAGHYFGLPELRVLHKDGRGFIEQADETWDVIVHDVFSGGSVPQSLFTLEMWGMIGDVLSDNGILAVNFVGSIGNASVRAIVATLLISFNFCRAFHDPFASEEGPSNMVMFCSSSTIHFRKANAEDFFGSTLREQVLSTFLNFEIHLPNKLRSESDLFGEILTDSDNILNDLQKDGALEHWQIIRKVLAEEVWVNY